MSRSVGAGWLAKMGGRDWPLNSVSLGMCALAHENHALSIRRPSPSPIISSLPVRNNKGAASMKMTAAPCC